MKNPVAEITIKIDQLLEKQHRCNAEISKLFTEIEKQKDQFWAIEREIIGLERMRAKAKAEIESI